MVQVTFGQLGKQTLLSKCLKNKLQTLFVFFSGLREEQDAINVHDNEFANVRSKDLVHGRLKCCWCICQTKAQHFKLLVPKWRAECSLWNIFWSDAYLMIARLQVNRTPLLWTADQTSPQHAEVGICCGL